VAVPSQIDKISVFCDVVERLPAPNRTFADLIAELDERARTVHGQVSSQALSNAHGDWFEWLLAIAAWNESINSNSNAVALRIPNVAQLDSASLYSEELMRMILHLRTEVEKTAGVRLITSNPDFALLRWGASSIQPTGLEQIEKVDSQTLLELSRRYESFKGNCNFEDIVGYVSAKYSLRPDRRLQIPHEGSLFKALHVHLQTRLWITDPNPLLYFAISEEVGPSDKSALKTVATHSITVVSSTPKAAVDEVYQVKNLADATATFRAIYANSIQLAH
jgi:hypothetical protein